MIGTSHVQALLWRTVCLIWQECNVQKVINVLCGTGGTAAPTVELQSGLVSLIQETEQLVGATIRSTYKFKLFSRLAKVIETEGIPIADILADSLAEALQYHVVEQQYNSLCFFYGEKSNPSIGSTELQHNKMVDGEMEAIRRTELASSFLALHMMHVLDWVVIKASSDMLAGDTGCHVWQAGLYLSQWILNNSDKVSGKRCLELGSGTGLFGVALVRSGATEVLLTDGNEEAVSNCRHNVEVNEKQHSAGQCLAAWSSDEQAHAGVLRKCEVSIEILQWGSRRIGADVVLASDVVYNEDVLPSLVKQLQMELRSGECSCEGSVRHPIALLASTVRNPATIEKFVQLCCAGGLVVQELERAQFGGDAMAASHNLQVKWQHCEALEGDQEIVLHHIS